jgi:hypothetical protein
MTVIHRFRAPVIDGAAVSDFRARFNSEHFGFRHKLAAHPLFSLGQLAEVAEHMTASGLGRRVVDFSASRESPSRTFDQLASRDGARDTLRQIETGSSWLRMSFVQEHDARYREVYDHILEDVEGASGYPLRRSLSWSSMTVMVSSPGIVTPYHIDHESNLLFQIAGEKDIWLFDPRDSRVLCDEEIEKYYVGDIHAANFRPDAAPLGVCFHLEPGLAIHNPPLGPHWVKNGGEVSVSVSLNFSLRPFERKAKVYQMNYYLRRIGYLPAAPKSSRIGNLMKGAVMRIGAVRRPRNLDDLLQPGPRRLLARLRRRRFQRFSGRTMPSAE